MADTYDIWGNLNPDAPWAEMLSEDTFQVVVVTVQKLYHTVHKGAVLGGLEGVGLKEFVIVHKVKGKCGETFPLLP